MKFLEALLARFRTEPPDPENIAKGIEGLKAIATPCINFELDGGGRSRLGGLPDLSSGTPWPRWRAKPLAFVAQLDLAELKAAGGPAWLPETGVLLFFYNVEQLTSGYDPGEMGSWRVLFERDPNLTESRPEPEDMPVVKGRASRYAPHPIRFKSGYSLADDASLDFGISRAETRAALESLGMWDEQKPLHQVAGHPAWIQTEMELDCQLVSNGLNLDREVYETPKAKALEAGKDDWRLLLQLDSDPTVGMNWAIKGRMFFWIRENDARAGDFSKVWMFIQY